MSEKIKKQTNSLRRNVFLILERESPSKLAEFIHYFLMVLILFTVVAVILESDPEIYSQYHDAFIVFEFIALIIFTLEYFLRVWSSAEVKQYRGFRGRLRYIFTPMALVDLIAILPVWFGFFLYKDLMILRSLRLVRVFKLTRHSRSMNLLISVLKQESANIFSAFFILSILIIIAATGIHIVEGNEQPLAFGTIPKAIWWATVTLTTVGYGDVIPISASGKVFGVIIVMSGIGMAALPAGILASGFNKEIQRRNERFKRQVMAFLADGEIDKNERKKLQKLAYNLAISQQDMKAIIWELKKLQLKNTTFSCPHCDQSIVIEHYSDNLRLKHQITNKHQP